MRVLSSLAPAQAGASIELARPLGRGPGLRRGEDLPMINRDDLPSSHAPFRLHHGLQTLRRDLYRRDEQPAPAGGTTSLWLARQPHGPLQHPATGLVRGARGLDFCFQSRTADEGMAAQLEGSTDCSGQSRMAGCDGGYSLLTFAPAQAGATIKQSRSSHRGPGLRRGDWDRMTTDGLLHAVLDVAGVVG